MILRFANIYDMAWLLENDLHIEKAVLIKKIENNQVLIVQDGNELIGCLRYGLFLG